MGGDTDFPAAISQPVGAVAVGKIMLFLACSTVPSQFERQPLMPAASK